MTREQTIYVPFEKLEDVFGKEERGVFLPYREFLEMWNRLNLPEKLKNSEPPVEGVLAAANYAGAATRCSFPPRAATKSRQWSSGRIARATGRSTLRLKLPRTSVSQFKMTIPEKGLDFASTPAAAFSAVEDVGAESLDGDACRVLDLFLMPELAQSLRDKDWAARVWVRGDGLPARLSVARTGWQMVVRCERLEFSKALPPETWQPTAEQAGDILRLDAARYGQLLEFITK